MTRDLTATAFLLSCGANVSATSRPGPRRLVRLGRRCLDCDRALREDEGDPCDRCNDAAYYRAQAAEDR